MKELELQKWTDLKKIWQNIQNLDDLVKILLEEMFLIAKIDWLCYPCCFNMN
jgi:hypothetical protein